MAIPLYLCTVERSEAQAHERRSTIQISIHASGKLAAECSGGAWGEVLPKVLVVYWRQPVPEDRHREVVRIPAKSHGLTTQHLGMHASGVKDRFSRCGGTARDHYREPAARGDHPRREAGGAAAAAWLCVPQAAQTDRCTADRNGGGAGARAVAIRVIPAEHAPVARPRKQAISYPHHCPHATKIRSLSAALRG